MDFSGCLIGFCNAEMLVSLIKKRFDSTGRKQNGQHMTKDITLF